MPSKIIQLFNDATGPLSGGQPTGDIVTVFANQSEQNAGLPGLVEGGAFVRTDLGVTGYRLGGAPRLQRPERNALDFANVAGTLTEIELNVAVAWCVTNNYDLFVPPGAYDLNSTWYIGTAGAMTSLNVRCQDVQFTYNGSFDKPAIAVQGLYDSRIAGVKVQTGAAYVVPNANVANAWQLADSTYFASGASVLQRAPFVGIAVDPFAGSDPGSGQGYPGATYGQQRSSGIVLAHCAVSDFPVGFAIGVSGSGVGTENVTLSRCNVVQTLVSIANDAAGTVIENGVYGVTKYVLDTATFGSQEGEGVAVLGGVWGDCLALFNLASVYGVTSVSALQADNFASLGWLTKITAAAIAPVTFTGCRFVPRTFTAVDVAPYRPWAFVQSKNPVTFTGCRFELVNDTVNYFANGLDASVMLQNSQVLFTTSEQNVTFLETFTQSPLCQLYGSSIRVSNLLEGADQNAIVTSPDTAWINRGTVGRRTYLSRNGQMGDIGVVVLPSAARSGAINLGSVTSKTFTATTLTFTVTDGTIIRIGDNFYWQMLATSFPGAWGTSIAPALRVTNVAGNVVTCALLYPRAEYDETYAIGLLRRYAQATVMATLLPATVTNGSATVACAVNPQTYFRAGDWVRGFGVAANSRITAVTSTTVTLNKVATASGDTALCDALISPPALAGENWTDGTFVSGGTVYIDTTKVGSHRLDLAANTTVKFLLARERNYHGFQLAVTLNGFTLTWPANITWIGGSAPTLATGATVNVVEFWCDPYTYQLYGWLASAGGGGSGLPGGGSDGQLLGRVSGSPAWVAGVTGLPGGGSDGQILGRVSGNPTWISNPAAQWRWWDTSSGGTNPAVNTVAEVSAAFGNLPVYLPQTHTKGDRIGVRLYTTAAAVIYVTPYAGQTINGRTSYPLAYDYAEVVVESDGANWFVLSEARWRKDTFGPAFPYTMFHNEDLNTATLTAASTVYLPPSPYTGEEVSIKPTLAGNTLTINGNGNNIASYGASMTAPNDTMLRFRYNNDWLLY